MTGQHTTYRVEGTLAGPLFWPAGEEACKEFRYQAERPGLWQPTGLRDLAETIMRHEDGDFAGAANFLADTILTIERHGRTHSTVRTWPLSAFASIADYCSPDQWPVWEDGD